MVAVQINCASFGSTGNIATEIHKELKKEGNESYVFYGIGQSDDKNIVPVSPKIIVRIHSFLSRITGLQGYFSYFATKKLIRKIKKINPDVIHLHNLHGSYLCLPVLFKFLKGFQNKLIITLHDCWLFTGKCTHFTEIGCYKWTNGCFDCPQLRTYPRSLFFDCSKKAYKDKKKWLSGLKHVQIIAVSDWLKETASQSFLGQYNIKKIYNGVDETVFYPRKNTEKLKKILGLEGKFVILGVSSNWNEQKGLGDFYKLAKLLHSNEEILLVGLTQEQIENLPPNIKGIQKTQNKDELASLYSLADVFVHTSVEETFGMVTAEAMACGTPVIVYDSTACGEIVTKDTGFVVPPHSIQLIIERIAEIKNKNALKNKKSFIYFSKKMVQNYCEVYKL